MEGLFLIEMIEAEMAGVMIFMREDLPSKQLFTHTFYEDIEALIIEINLRNTKFLLVGGYRPPSQSQNYFFHFFFLYTFFYLRYRTSQRG